MKKLISFFLLFTVLSCDTVEEFFLYEEGDPELVVLKAMALQACIDDADIFDALDLAGDFENGDQLGRIYKISQDTASSATIYVKVTSVTATEMTLVFNSSDNEFDKILTFEKDDHNNILSELQIMSCNTEYDSHFSVSGLDDNDSMTLTWEKQTVSVEDDDDEDDIDEAYEQRTDKYTFDNDYPLFFFYYSATKTSVEKEDDDEEESSVTSTLTITEVTDEDECDSGEDDYNSSCEFDNVTRACDLEVNLSTYTSNAFSDEILSISGDSDCELLDSAIQ